MKVPMPVHWKGHIPAGQIINVPISTLDFTATTLKLASGEIPAEFDGVDLLPFLTRTTSTLTRAKDLFWDWGDGIALQRDGWKIHRYGSKLALFNIMEDPNEFYDLQAQRPEKFKELEAALMARHRALPEEGRSKLRGGRESLYVIGAPAQTPVEPRYRYPYQDGKPIAYPAPLKLLPVSLDRPPRSPASGVRE